MVCLTPSTQRLGLHSPRGIEPSHGRRVVEGFGLCPSSPRLVPRLFHSLTLFGLSVVLSAVALRRARSSLRSSSRSRRTPSVPRSLFSVAAIPRVVRGRIALFGRNPFDVSDGPRFCHGATRGHGPWPYGSQKENSPIVACACWPWAVGSVEALFTWLVCACIPVASGSGDCRDLSESPRFCCWPSHECEWCSPGARTRQTLRQAGSPADAASFA